MPVHMTWIVDVQAAALGLGPVRFSYNPSFSACFFQLEQCFSLTTNQPEQCFGLFFQRRTRLRLYATTGKGYQHGDTTWLSTAMAQVASTSKLSKSVYGKIMISYIFLVCTNAFRTSLKFPFVLSQYMLFAGPSIPLHCNSICVANQTFLSVVPVGGLCSELRLHLFVFFIVQSLAYVLQSWRTTCPFYYNY